MRVSFLFFCPQFAVQHVSPFYVHPKKAQENLSVYTPLKTNMSPENQWLEDVFPIEMVPF